ncbi:MAG: UDP-N-acetylglucosamine 1-carboxyvinyltransferase, partial [Thiotrichaceae bacterium]|nr:UDP-N-acetylglucosamine 1-carboxyvinyltransferase [Thiotrichaceae bacterium]
MDKIQITGGKKLQGEVNISGAKNAALPLIASSILVKGKIKFSNVPDLMDINSIRLLLEDLGAKCNVSDVSEVTGGCLEVDGSYINKIEAQYDLV